MVRVPTGGRRADVPVRLHGAGVQAPVRGSAVFLGRRADRLPGVRGQAPQGLLGGGCGLQGLRLLPHRQPGRRQRQEGGRVLLERIVRCQGRREACGFRRGRVFRRLIRGFVGTVSVEGFIVCSWWRGGAGGRQLDWRFVRKPNSRSYWDEAARTDPYWHIATSADGDTERFYAVGAAETDALLALCGIVPDEGRSVLEIGCGAGRMRRRLAELFGQVIALDVSAEMLKRGREALADRDNVGFLQGNGVDLSGVADQSVDLVFSYITLQHVP